jgi:hypothetical protein
MNLSLFVIVLAWANGLMIAWLAIQGYYEAVCGRFEMAKSHLRLAGLIAVMSALLTTTTIASQRNQRIEKENNDGPSWNAYPAQNFTSAVEK